MNKRYELLIFDWDGTLVDSQALITDCMQRAAMEAGLPPHNAAEIGGIIGLGLTEAIERLYPDAAPAAIDAIVQGYRRCYVCASPDRAPLFPGAARTLAELKTAGYRLAIATGKGRSGLDRGLALCDIADLFCVSRCADECRSKPDPAMLHEILAHTGVAAGHALMIGDTEYDLAMAQRAGVDALAVSYGVRAKEHLLALQPVGCIDAITELPRWLPASTRTELPTARAATS